MRIPDFIKNTDSIGFIAPSFGCSFDPYKSGMESAKKKFEDMGHTVVLGPNCYEGSGIGISNTPEKCGQEVNEFFAKGELAGLISCGGGELMCEILDYVNFEELKKLPPKWFVGYSDNTNLTFLLPTLCDTAAVYAPCAPAYGMRTWHPSLQDTYDLLRGKKKEITGYPLWEKESLKTEDNPLEPYNVTEPVKIHAYPESSFSMTGRLLGGCLDCLGNLVGTKYDKVNAFTEKYQEEGIVWFLEACELNRMSVRRTLWQLKHAGWFENAKGFLVGRPMTEFGEIVFGLDQYEAVTAVLGDLKVPIVMDVDLGHLPPMMPMIAGAKAQVFGSEEGITIKYDL